MLPPTICNSNFRQSKDIHVGKAYIHIKYLLKKKRGQFRNSNIENTHDTLSYPQNMHVWYLWWAKPGLLQAWGHSQKWSLAEDQWQCSCLAVNKEGPCPDSQNCCAMGDGCVGKHQKSPFFPHKTLPADEWYGLSLPSLMPAARRLLTVPTALVSHLYKALQSSQNYAQYTHRIYPSQGLFPGAGVC